MTNKLKTEGVEDLQPNANYQQIDSELDNASLEEFCRQLDFLATSDDEKAKALFNTFKRGWKREFGKVEVETGTVFIRDLHPTQNVIYANKSLKKILNGQWNVEGFDFAVDAFLSEQSPEIEMGDPLVVCEVDGTYYLIDGHHRWSKAYSFNPNCKMYAHLIKNSKNIFSTADDVLKFAQGTLTALRNTSPINDDQPETDYNMYTMTFNDLVEIVENNLTDEVLEHIVNSPLIEGSIKDVGGVCTYLWANINVMKKYAPAGIHDRIFMPQYPDGDSNPANAVSLIAAESKKTINENTKVTLTIGQLKKLVIERDEMSPPGSWEPSIPELVQTILDQGIKDEEIEGWLADQGITDRETSNAVLDGVSEKVEDDIVGESEAWTYPNSNDYPEWIDDVELDADNQYDVERAFECAGWEIMDSDSTGFRASVRDVGAENPVPTEITMSHGDKIMDVVNNELDALEGTERSRFVSDVKDELVTMFNLGFVGQDK